MKLLLYLANIFINTFGITQPAPGAANRAARLIALMLLLVLILLAVIALVLHTTFSHQAYRSG